MNLEDHLGDIIRKARAMSGVSAASAAKAAGLTEAELATIEEFGTGTGSPNFTALAELVGLNPDKLKQVAGGWLPSERDLGTWREFRRITTTANDMAVNCYLIWDEVCREAAL